MDNLPDLSKLSVNDDKVVDKDNELLNALKYLRLNLNSDLLQDITNRCLALTNYCKGNGAGLTSGTMIDMLICELFKKNLPEYQEYKIGEADIKICDTPLSLKKINGKSIIALCWSKNPVETAKYKAFKNHILILNLTTEKWWKAKESIKSGIYLIDKEFCKANINLCSNNKSDTVIDSGNLYKMLQHSIETKLFIELPEKNKDIKYSILTGFSE